MKKPHDVKSLIDWWPARKDLAADVEVPLDRVHKWAQSGAIPARFHARLLRAAQRRAIPISADDLILLHDKGEAA